MRKIIGNMLVAIFMPIIASARWFPNIYKAIFHHVYEYYDFHIETLSELIYYTLFESFGLLYTWSLVFILFPFQLIKDYHYNRDKKGLALWKKCLLLSGIIAFWFALLFRPPITEMKDRIILFASIFLIGTLFSLILYITVDRYVERKTIER